MSLQTLRPDYCYYNGGWTQQPANTTIPVGSIDNFLGDNSDSTYASIGAGEGAGTPTPPALDLGFANLTIPSDALIQSVACRVKELGSAGDPIELEVRRYNGTSYIGAGYDRLTSIGSTWTNPFPDHLYCPSTGLQWTITDVNAIGCSIRHFPVSGGGCNVYEVYCDVSWVPHAVVTVTGPTGTLSTPQPTVTWQWTAETVQRMARVRVFSDAVYNGADFNPETSPAVIDSGTINGSAPNWSLPTGLTDGSYRVYVKAAQYANGLIGAPSTDWSDWAYSSFVLNRGPNVPTLRSPANNAHLDLSGATAFMFQYTHPSPSTYLHQYAFRRKVVGGTYYYWNAGTQLWSGSVTWNTVDATTSGPTTVNFPAGAWANQATYVWSVDATDSDAQESGYSPEWTVVGDYPPAVTVTAPTGTIGTIQPAVQWTFYDPDPGGAQDSYQVKIFTETQAVVLGFSPDYSTPLWDSGTRTGTASTLSTGVLTVNVALRAYVRVHSSAAWSPWGYTPFTIAASAPAAPIIVGGDSASLAERALAVRVQAMDNAITWPQADPQQTSDLDGLTAYNCSAVLAASATPSHTYAVKLTCGSGTPGEMRYRTRYDGVGGVVAPGSTYTGSVSIRSLNTTQRSCQCGIQWVDSSGNAIRTDYGLAATNSSVTWTRYTVSAQAPSGAVGGEVVARIAEPATNEVHYIERFCLKPAAGATTWSRGGLVGWSYAQLERVSQAGTVWADVGDPVRVPTASQLVSVMDWGAPQATATYRARTIVYANDLASTYGSGVIPSPTQTTPGLPLNVVGTDGTNTVTLTWQPPTSDGGSPITGYRVTVGTTTTTVGASIRTATITMPTGTYTTSVTAINAIGAGPAASGGTVTVTGGGGATVPGIPLNVVATGGTNTFTVTWTPPTSNGGSPITVYTVNLPGQNAANVAAGSPLTVTFTGQAAGTYQATVQAGNAIGWGPIATSNSATVGGPPIAADIYDMFNRSDT